MSSSTAEWVDVLVIGAGLSGICAGWYLQKRCPDKSYAILEARDAIGGTWDFFRYPGIRSDSDMHTLGYSFKPWPGSIPLADGPLIRDYVRDTAREYGIDQHIHFNHKLVSANWDSVKSEWQSRIKCSDGSEKLFASRFLFQCSGYYDYEESYTPAFAGLDTFEGAFVHPQFWPENLDYEGKRVVVIGSGATAVTLIPAMAEKTAHITMLQRSPSYVAPAPRIDKLARWLHGHAPLRIAHALVRWRNILLDSIMFRHTRKHPQRARARLRGYVEAYMGRDFPIDEHFNPHYNPWDQRLCIAPDGDLFMALRSGKASIITDSVARFDRSGIILASGQHLDADIVVSATGLKLQNLGGAQISIDGAFKKTSSLMGYKAMMFSGLPNFLACFGYTNASWTLKCELTCAYLCRLINYMDQKGYRQAVPQRDPSVEERPWVEMSSGYLQRGEADLPKQGDRTPWRIHQNYMRDLLHLRFSSLDDGVLDFA